VAQQPVSDKRAKTSRSAARSAVTVYDFRRPTKLSREHMRMLQLAYETFARRLTTVLTSGLREVCLVTVTDITQLSYDEYVGTLSTPTLMVPMSLPPLAGTAVLEMSLGVALAAIDHLLGGPGGKQQTRTLTDIETTLFRGLIDQMLSVLQYSLEPMIAIEPTAGSIEYTPQFLQAASAADAVIVAEFAMAIGKEECRLTVCIPLAPLLPRLATHRPRDAALEDSAAAIAAATRRMRNRLSDVPLEISVRFEPVHLSPARILSLAVGDVLVLDHRVGAPLSVEASGVTFARAIAGKSGTHLAALVVGTPTELPRSTYDH